MKEPLIFRALILQHKSMNAGYINFPFSTEQLYNTKGQVKVKVILDHRVEYRGSLANMGKGHCLILTQAVRKNLEKSFGDWVDIQIWKDIEERIVVLPDDVKILLETNPKAQTLYEALAYTYRKEFIRWIEDAKKEETRENRKNKMIQMLLDGKKGV